MFQHLPSYMYILKQTLPVYTFHCTTENGQVQYSYWKFAKWKRAMLQSFNWRNSAGCAVFLLYHMLRGHVIPSAHTYFLFHSCWSLPDCEQLRCWLQQRDFSPHVFWLAYALPDFLISVLHPGAFQSVLSASWCQLWFLELPVGSSLSVGCKGSWGR